MLTVIHIPMLSGCFHVAGAVMDIFMVPCMSYFWGRFHRNFVDVSRSIYPMDWLPKKMTSDYRLYLVGGLEQWNFMTFHILGMSSSQLTNSITFQRAKFNPPTSYRLYRLCPECFLRLCPDFDWFWLKSVLWMPVKNHPTSLWVNYNDLTVLPHYNHS